MTIKKKIGLIIRSFSPSTKIVLVQNKYLHKKYQKFLIKSKHYMIDDKQNLSKLGDIVIIKECSPVSKKKRWKLFSIINNNNYNL